MGTYIYKFTSDLVPGVNFLWYECPVGIDVVSSLAESSTKVGAEKLLDQVLLLQKIYTGDNARQYDKIEFEIVAEETD